MCLSTHRVRRFRRRVLGTFELWEKAFSARCGLAVDSVGRVYSRLCMEPDEISNLKDPHTPLPKGYVPQPRRKARSQNAAVQAVQVVSLKITSEVACQTDATDHPSAGTILRGDAPSRIDLSYGAVPSYLRSARSALASHYS